MSDKSHYQVFAEKMMHKDSKYIPEILKSMIDDEQAGLLLSLPGTAESMAKKMDRPEDQVEADLKEMFIKGLTFKRTKEGVTTWRAAAHLAQFHDASILWADAPKEFLDLWRKYMNEEWPQLAAMVTKILPKPFTRVIPVEKSLDAGKTEVLAPESIREVIEGAKRFAVTKCTCRHTMHECDAPVEVCLQINRGADYTVERGSGRELTKEQALELIEQCEEAGLVHVTMNKSGIGHFICNCCGCCCQSFTLLISDGYNLCDPSRYRPEVDAKLCSACGDCEDRCFFDAMEMGDDVAVVIEDKCMGCGQCAIGCPEEAITLAEIREPGFIPG